MATIVIDAGHGGTDPGAVNGGRQEKNDNLAMAIAVGRILECRCHRVVYTRQTDVFVPLEERARISNNANADIFVSIHRNAFTNNTANGVENIVRNNATAQERTFAQNVLNRIAALNVFTNRGLKTGNFLVLNSTRAPAQLVEVGFISNAQDNQRLDANFSRIVTAIADGIEDSVGRMPNCGNQPPPPPPPPPIGSNLTGVVRTSGGNLNMRSAPSATAPVVGQIPNGSTVQIVGHQNGFYQVVFGGMTGWASDSFINVNPRSAVVTTQGGSLNLRSAPNTSSAVIATIPNGSTVVVSDIAGDFFRVTWNGQTGFASRSFIRT